ncbi:MAG: nucleoid-associated protein [Methylobacter tundripaludum]|nr:nucleoid-associated protein [Methylobacter tundripaludum]
MTTLDFTQVELQQLITHHIGNRLRDEKIVLSNEVSTIEKDTKNFLLKYFLLPIKAEEFFSFSHTVKLELNELFTIVEDVFSNPELFINSSQSIAKLLYEQSMHPKIKEGELNIAYFSNVVLDDEIVEAIGIFKSETNVPFIKMKNQKSKFSINHDYGFEIKGMDKGCIVFNIDQNKGYKILIVDNANKSTEAQYWKDNFLKVKPISNEFHQTNQFLGITKNFVTKQLSEELEVSKADKINLLNRSVEYFKTHESFDKNEFEQEVLQDLEMIKSFCNYDSRYREKNNIELPDNFEISPQAVKKQSRVFRSVLKLDKNFHIYIHGSRELIEQGIETDGRKFYKIYFQQES